MTIHAQCDYLDWSYFYGIRICPFVPSHIFDNMTVLHTEHITTLLFLFILNKGDCFKHWTLFVNSIPLFLIIVKSLVLQTFKHLARKIRYIYQQIKIFEKDVNPFNNTELYQRSTRVYCSPGNWKTWYGKKRTKGTVVILWMFFPCCMLLWKLVLNLYFIELCILFNLHFWLHAFNLFWRIMFWMHSGNFVLFFSLN